MFSAFLSPSLKQDQIDFINRTISMFNGRIIDEKQQSDIIITSNVDLIRNIQGKPHYITFHCYKSMIDLRINPFTYPYQISYMNNLYLFNKTINFYKISQENEILYTNLIYSMGGSIIDNNGNYIITDETKFDNFLANSNSTIINAKWLFSLQHSKLYISPENYYLNSQFLHDDSFFNFAFNLFKNHKHWGYNDLKKNLEPIYKFLKSETNEQFKKICQPAFNKIKSIQNSNGDSSLFQTKKLNENEIHSNLVNSNKMKTLQTNELIIKGPWSEIEIDNLLIVLRQGYLTNRIFNDKGEFNWPVVSNYIEGRTGKSCKNKYYRLKKSNDQRLTELFEGEKDENIYPYQANDYFHKSLSNDEEQLLYQKISDLIDNNCLVTVKMIQEMALKIYNSPLSIASKSFVISKFKEKKSPFNEKGQINIEKFGSEFDTFLTLANDEPQKLIEDYLTDFHASRSWVCNYMMRNNLVFKKSHFKRRGQVSEFQVERYLNEVAEAIEEYGPQGVINMDETSVKTQNFPSKVISKKGKDDTFTELTGMNDKEATTFLGAISYDPNQKIPLGIISKGKTHVCEKKFGLKPNCKEFIAHTKSGWTSSEVIIKYLNWLKPQIKREKFALIIDVYKSHINQSVKDEAERLGIQLIYVPASGTSLYQPLDIAIYGITKNKLAQKEQEDPISMNKDRFKCVTTRMIETFDNLSDRSIKAAWNIPYLDKLVVSESNDDESDEWNPEDDK